MRGLEGVKVGDTIKVARRFGMGADLYKVERLTKTQAICGNVRFMIDSGMQVGSRDRWYSSWGSIATEADIAAIAQAKRIKSVQEAIGRTKVTAANLEAAEAFIAASQKASG